MIYLDNAATSYPKPKIVYDKLMESMMDYGANPGRAGHKMAVRLNREIYRARKNIVEIFNGSKTENVIFTSNATESLNLGILGILKKGDHVITSNLEHNSVLRILYKLEMEKKIELSIIDLSSGQVDIGQLNKLARDNTKLIAINHMSNVTGSLVDIEKIGDWSKKRGIKFLLDGSQSAGVYPIDIKNMKIDLLAFPGHKGLLGPQGTGGLYIGDNIDLRPLIYGGTGSFSESLDQPSLRPDRFESGTVNGPGIVGLAYGIDYINNKGMEKIRIEQENLTYYFIDRVKDIDGIKVYGQENRYQGPVVSINIKDVGSSEIAYILDDKYDIAVRSGLHCAPLIHKKLGTLEQGTVRFSFSFNNTYEEIDKTIKALEEIADLY